MVWREFKILHHSDKQVTCEPTRAVFYLMIEEYGAKRYIRAH